MRSAIVTIDGPAGAGKSTTARALAQRLGFEYLDTGAMYRALSLAVVRAELGPAQEDKLAALLARIDLQMLPGKVILNGEEITDFIRSPAISGHASELAAIPEVRQRMVELQRAIARGRRIVCEGRDQGTVVFPDAPCKFFLVAAPEERARRRQRELAARGELVTLAEVLQAQAERDARDAQRSVAPMKPAADAIIVDTTTLNLEQVVARLEQECSRCLGGSLS